MEDILDVKKHVMPFLLEVEEAKMAFEIAERNRDEELEITGNLLDPEGEHEILDCEEEVVMDHPDYLHIQLPEEGEQQVDITTTHMQAVPAIEIPSKEEIIDKARFLDKHQKVVLHIALWYARILVKARKAGKRVTKAPLVMAHGGAGVGKYTVIYVLATLLQDELQQPGDNINCPIILIVAFTGVAAANVNGQTISSTFGAKFG